MFESGRGEVGHSSCNASLSNSATEMGAPMKLVMTQTFGTLFWRYVQCINFAANCEAEMLHNVIKYILFF